MFQLGEQMRPFILQQNEIGNDYTAVSLLKNDQEILKFPLNPRFKKKAEA